MKSRFPFAVIQHTKSPPSQGAWIEISTILIKVADSCVAPLAGGVD